MLSPNEINLPLLLLYAEIHYRFFPFFPSLLFKREPEVLFDVPYRVGPGEDLPILLIINDLVRFHAEPQQVAVTVSQPSTGTKVYHFSDLKQYEVDHPFKKLQRAFILPVAKRELPIGQLFINATVTLKNEKKKWMVFNDNLNTSSKRAFSCYCADNPLPGKELCSYGDIHVHSQFSQSHVEFGPPLAVIDRIAKSCGLSFVGITDHSYDLSCLMDNYLNEDQSLERWNQQKEELSDTLNFSTIMIQGEEISCQNLMGSTVHLGALGISDFIPGSRDGARKRLHFKQQLTIKQAVNEIHRQGGFAFAAHPVSRSGLLQRLFLHRGAWSEEDFHEQIDGIQAFNNGINQSWVRGKKLWLKLLQQGNRIPLLAGNDAHGDFNRYRAIKRPFLSINEDFQRFMGYGKTGIYGKCTNAAEVLNYLYKGSIFITTGPYISIDYSKNPKNFSISSAPSRLPGNNLYIHAISTPEFGALGKISLFTGSTQKGINERIFYVTNIKETIYELQIPVETKFLSTGEYLRAEVETILKNRIRHHAYTNCYFFD
ncbi:MAG: PHP domain-containing protein [Chitinispirillaceae bacterium]|nr:PHP domain-containing protein [Chitinispirillaceae bacterium]